MHEHFHHFNGVSITKDNTDNKYSKGETGLMFV